VADKKVSSNASTTQKRGYEEAGRTIGYRKDYKVKGTTNKKKASK